MKRVQNASLWPVILTGFLLSNCGRNPGNGHDEFLIGQSSENELDESSHVEDVILALPAFAFHEESIESFEERVRMARKTEPANKNASENQLYVGSDGTWPAKDFFWEHNTQTLLIRVHGLEPLERPYETTMRKVAGGWIKGSDKNL